jgi:hypothetical protein
MCLMTWATCLTVAITNYAEGNKDDAAQLGVHVVVMMFVAGVAWTNKK